MEKTKKILFLQEFSMERRGGGVSIISRLIESAGEFNFLTQIAYDRTANKGQPANTVGQTSFYTLPRNIRFGIGKAIAWLTLFSLDIFSFFSLVKLIKRENPDIIHITAHGVCLPIMVKAARYTKKKIVMSVHDIWFFSVKSYISESMSVGIFKTNIKHVETVYVISKQMQNYLRGLYGEKNYQVVHDGISLTPELVRKKFTANHLSFFYVGFLHSMQVAQLNRLIEVMGSFSEKTFTIGVCSGTGYVPQKRHGNIEVVNYGWLKEDKVKEISREYSYGLLPLSFAPCDELFYRTSLMTKIPFYIGVLLPIICIGPKSASAVQLINHEKTGIVADSGTIEEIEILIKNLLEQSPEIYQQYIRNLIKSAETTFNIEHITKRFYENLFMTSANNYSNGV